jgi:TonB-linked SusC/RagA family outer membrane protein
MARNDSIIHTSGGLMPRRISLFAWVALALSAGGLSAQTVVQGTVRSETQSAVRGAFVLIPSLNLSAVTNDNGQYKIPVPADRASGQVQMTVSSIGYRSVDVQVTLRAGTITQDFIMAEQAVVLNEVLVTGTAGRQERRAQAAVVATVPAAKVAEVAPVQTVANLLQARTPGVVIRNQSGTTGTGQSIRIRGISSISLSNEPLVFLDGVRIQGGDRQIYGVGNQQGSALNDINVEEIESIEIVKGPAAATLYGSDANAGVINIITKKGRTNSGFTQSFTVEYGESSPNFTPPDNYGRCATGNATNTAFPACANVPVGTILVDNPLVRESSFLDGRYRNLNWQLRGGGERYAVFMSLGADDDNGTLPHNTYGHISGRTNIDFFIGENLRMELGFGLTRVEADLPTNDNNIYGYLGGGLLGDPRTRCSPNCTQTSNKDGWYAPNRQTLTIESHEVVDKTIRTQPRAAVQYNPFPWFSNRVTFGADITRSKAYSFWAKNDFGWWDSAPTNTGQNSEARQAIDRLTFDYLGNVTKVFSNSLRGDFSFGSQIQARRTDLTSAQGTGLVSNDVRNVSSAAQLTGGGQSASEDRQVGFFGQAQVTWRERVYLQLGGRVDQASSFGIDSEPFYSPKVGVSYVISDESFFRNMFSENLVSALRIRAAYGVTGRAPNSGARSTYNPTTNQITPTAVAVGVSPGTTGNPDIRAEKGREIELGFEAGILNDRLGIDLTFFHKKTTDQILTLPVPGSLGASGPSVNIGAMLNRGFEIAANARLLTMPNLAWEVRGAVNTIHNELLDLGSVPESATRKEGFPIVGRWDYTIKEVDLVNNRVIVSDTLEFRGTTQDLPGYEGNLNSTLTLFRNLTFYAQADFRGDVLAFNNTDQFRDRSNGFSGLAVLGCAFYREDQDPTKCTDEERTKHMRKFGPWVTTTGRTLSRGTVAGDYNEDAGFVRLREASVSYRVPSALVQRVARAQSAQVTVAFRNLKTWTNFTGLDPETDQFLTVPQDKRWTVRFNFTF